MSAPLWIVDIAGRRHLMLWYCLGLFCLRVVGQFEVLVAASSWLPPFTAWESGLVPYGVLLPVQIALIAGMTLIAADSKRGAPRFWSPTPTTRHRLKIAAGIYFAIMLVRLVITAALPPHSLLERGLIPIVAHWDLATFLYIMSCNTRSCRATRSRLTGQARRPA